MSSVYTRERCLKYCTLNELVASCNCIDSYDFDFTSDEELLSSVDNNTFEQCSTTEEVTRKCHADVYEKFANNQIECPCWVPCESTKYTYRASRSQWPSPAHSSYLASRLIKEDLPRVTAYLRNLHNVQNLTKKRIHSSIKENFVRLSIFYESSSYQKIIESATYTYTDLLSDFGGNISLWLGWSIFALFEVLLFIIHSIEALYVKYTS